jgi:murein L,D-transpeptidase YcbB/YkuD
MIEDGAAHGIAADAPSVLPVATDSRALILAALDHARALHSGRLKEEDYLSVWGLRPPAYDPWPAFSQAVAQDRLASWIASLPPPYTGYDGLRRGLAAYKAIEAEGGWQQVPAGPNLTIGSTGPRVTALRRRLAVEDAANAGSTSPNYDAALAEQVRRAQKRYGLEPNGVANAETIAALNVPVGDRLGQITANMERWRWLPPELPRHRIQVNIAAAVLTVFEADAPVLSMRAVTGRPGDPTPMLSSEIHSIVINPPWNVPTSIATKELWPKERKNPGYFARSGFRVIETPDGGKRLQQKAGPKSALGRLKFDFDNKYSVYLHDTPTQSTFDRYQRLASHGCVRLQRPVELANRVLQGDPRWTSEALQAAIDAGKTVRAQLPERVSIFLLYWTAFAGADGQMNFRADPYGWDAILAKKIKDGANRAPLTTAQK